MAITTKIIDNKNEWEAFTLSYKEANFLQSWYWGEFHKSLKKKVVRTGFYNGEKLVGVMLLVVEPAKRGRYLTVPGGPLIDWNNKTLVAAFVSGVKAIAKKERCVFVRVRPQLLLSDSSKELFRSYGFADAPMHLHAQLTSQLLLAKSEEELLAGMRKTTRYEIKKAIQQNVTVTSSVDPKAIKQFYDLQIETAKRQKFVPFSYSFLHEQFRIFAEQGLALLYSAKHEGELLAQAFIIFYGQEAVYHYSASTDEGRKYPGAYLIQWGAILEAKKRGLSRYNFWGVAKEEEKQHRFYGISVFKRGFGGEDVSYLPAQDLVINKPRYMVNSLIENLRKKIRRV